ncbi:hypothetical protein STIUS_v1c00660 [Spiroplasma sp. TIUS-1]|uniref:lipoprotein n=1 Tax=Spiroplasma sp. TIUS-1 TaxID=216963 RepID=UPI001397066E|nr:lipoprotein [Spiroplasma sp. TIUS-1]QHX35621.1 hypothetical protein STIUS_v1c00660 [Spiroplasma sp. TIUS-1]
MKKLLAMLGAAGLVVSTSAVLVSCGTDPAPVSADQKKVNEAKEAVEKIAKQETSEATITKVEEVMKGFTIEVAVKDAISVIAKTEVKDQTVIVTFSAKVAVEAKTPEVTFEEGENPEVTYEWADSEATATATLSFGKVEVVKEELSTLIKITNFEDLVDAEVTTITAAINEKNAGAEGNYELGTPAEGKVTATAKGDKYQGTVKITFKVKDAETETPTVLSFFYQA